MAEKKPRSHRWSLKELKEMDSLIKAQLNEGLDIKMIRQRVGEVFGVTANAIALRHRRYLAGQSVPKKNEATVKEPTLGKRGPYKSRKPKVEASNNRQIVLPIKDVNLDLRKGTITITY